MPENAPCRHVGFWMVWERAEKRGTILPNEGIGVFACNLIVGLLQQREPVEVTVLCLDQHRDQLEDSLGPHPRLRVLSETGRQAKQECQRGAWSRLRSRLRRGWQRGVAALHARGANFKRRYEKVRKPRELLNYCTIHFGRRFGKLLMAPLFALIVVSEIIRRYAVTTGEIAGKFVIPVCNRVARWRNRQVDGSQRHSLFDTARKAGCDVWCVPTLNSCFPDNLPTVLLVYDLVTARFPEGIPTDDLVPGLRLAVANARKATLVVTMTDAIKRDDLQGLLDLPADKVRVVRTACPPPMSRTDSPRWDLDLFTEKPFLFYPSVCRPYKNFPLLIVVLSILKRKFGRRDLGLILTHGGTQEIHDQLIGVRDAFGLKDDVHIVLGLDAANIDWLYRRAALTVIPSLYEGIGLQFFEALESGCPVVGSDISVLREHAAHMNIPVPFFDPTDANDMARTIDEALANRETFLADQQRAYRAQAPRPWETVAAEYLDIFSAAMHRQAKPPVLESVESTGPYRVFLMLQQAYLGGVWVATKSLIHGLVELNRTRRELDLTLALRSEQKDIGDLNQIIRIEHLDHAVYPPEVVRTFANLDNMFNVDDERRRAEKLFVVGNLSAQRADAWCAMIDRFAYPLLPDRLYGVIVYDLIQVHVPECFPQAFFPIFRNGMMPTIRHANMVMTTNMVTLQDVKDHIGNVNQSVKLVPVAYEANERFQDIQPEKVPLPFDSFILNINNGSPHKGIDLMLKGLANLKQRLGEAAPKLVVCGVFTNAFSPRYTGSIDFENWKRTRQLVGELGLEEYRDVVFLGHLPDAQLLYLFQNCKMVVNSAKFDNGSYNLIEAHLFGKTAISNRYPAAEWLYERFNVPVRYFPLDDADALAKVVQQVVAEPPTADLTAIRENLLRPELNLRTYSERVYDMLVELGKKGRAQSSRTNRTPINRAA